MPPTYGKRIRVAFKQTDFFNIIVYMENNTNTDSLTLFVSKVISYCKTHAVTLGLYVVVIALIWAGTAFFLAKQEQRRQEAWQQYYQAQVALVTQGQQQAADAVAALKAAHPNSDAAYYAQLMLADLLFAQENYAQATEGYRILINAKNPYVRAIATVSLAQAQQATQDYGASIQTAQNFIAQNPSSFALPQAYFTLALSQELSGDKAAALETYKKILEDYTKTYFGVFAKDKITALSK